MMRLSCRSLHSQQRLERLAKHTVTPHVTGAVSGDLHAELLLGVLAREHSAKADDELLMIRTIVLTSTFRPLQTVIKQPANHAASRD